MPVIYNGSGLIPAPFVEISKTIIRGEDDKPVSTEVNFALRGTIVNVGTDLDSPGAQSFGAFDMNDILSEQERIRSIFSVQGGLLQIVPPNSGMGEEIDAYCEVDSIVFEPSTWTYRNDYVIGLKSTKIEGDTDPIGELKTFNENWNVTEQENGQHLISHEIQAVGKLIYSASGENNPLLAAKNYVKDRLYTIDTNGILFKNNTSSIDFANILSNIGSTSGNFWNYQLIEGIGGSQYSWRATENFLHNPSGNVLDQYSVTSSFEESNIKTCNISINGTIIGYSDRASDLTLRNQIAKNYFDSSVVSNLYLRAYNNRPSGYSVYPIPNNVQTVQQLQNGSLSYTYSFIASSGFLTPGAISESIEISDIGSTDIFAAIPVPGRSNGAIIQNMKTKTNPERSISININFGQLTDQLTTSSLRNLYNQKPNVDNIINCLVPSSGYYYLRSNVENYNPIKRIYNRNVSYILEVDGVAVSGIPSYISNPNLI